MDMIEILFLRRPQNPCLKGKSFKAMRDIEGHTRYDEIRARLSRLEREARKEA